MLPGIGPNRLTTRLRDLQSAGVATKDPEGRYALTPFGERLRDPVLGLAVWGLDFLPDGINSDAARADTIALGLASVVSADLLGDMNLVCRVDTDRPFTVLVEDGSMSVTAGGFQRQPTAVLTAAGTSFIDLAMGRLTVEEAEASGALVIAGDEKAIRDLVAVLATTAQRVMAHSDGSSSARV